MRAAAQERSKEDNVADEGLKLFPLRMIVTQWGGVRGKKGIYEEGAQKEVLGKIKICLGKVEGGSDRGKESRDSFFPTENPKKGSWYDAQKGRDKGGGEMERAKTSYSLVRQNIREETSPRKERNCL